MAITIGNTYTIQCVATSTYVNLSGTHSGTSISNGNVVNLYATCNGSDQKWILETFSSEKALTSSRNANYALNIKTSTGINQVWNKTTCTVNDSKLDFPVVNSASNIFNIRLTAHNLYLTRTGTGNDLYWSAKSGTSTSQQFKFVEVASGQTSPTDEFKELTATIAGECYLSKDYQDEWKCIANVVKNRMANAKWPSTMIDVLSQASQFAYGSNNYNLMMSWYDNGMSSSDSNASYYNKLISAVLPVYQGNEGDNSKTAVYFNKVFSGAVPYSGTAVCQLTFDKEHQFYKLT